MNWKRLDLGLIGIVLLGCSSARTGPSNVEPSSSGTVEAVPDSGTGVEGVGGPVSIDGVFNARHVGTIAVGSRRLRDQILIRSGDLGAVTDAGCNSLNAMQLRTIIDLRDEPDLSSRPDRNCGVPEPTRVEVTLPKLLPPNADNYLATLDATEPKLAALFTALTQADGPVLIHCVIGRDRATLTTALVLLALGVDEATVLNDAATNQDPTVNVDAKWFEGVTARIAEAGGILQYLEKHGVPAKQVEELRADMLE